jgi:hypothetical protein
MSFSQNRPQWLWSDNTGYDLLIGRFLGCIGFHKLDIFLIDKADTS